MNIWLLELFEVLLDEPVELVMVLFDELDELVIVLLVDGIEGTPHEPVDRKAANLVLIHSAMALT